MENESSKPLEQEIKREQRPTPSILPEGQFRFEPIAEMFETPDTNFNDYLMSSSLAADDVSGVNLYKADIDKFGINAMASLGVATPSFATDTYNPRTQDVPAEKNTFTQVKEILTLKDKGVSENRMAPIFSGMRQGNFLKYYSSPEFENLGYTPYANMENYYNENTTIYDDFARTGSNWMSLVGTGLNSVYGSMFSGTDYLEPDVDAATEFEDIMAITTSTRGGAGAFLNNLGANSAYTFGILASIAIEEVILAGAAALQGGMNPVSDAALIARTGKNIVTGGKALFSFTKLFERTRKILEKANQLETARDFWVAANTGGKMAVNALGRGFTPNTVKAFQNIKTAQNAGQNMSNLAKMGTKFGGFYRDLRAVNLAAAESKLEGGMVYNQVLKQGLTNMSNENGGRGVTEEMEGKVINAAKQASFYTMMANAPLIYASNWFVIGNALGGFQRGIQRTVGNTFQKGFNKNIVNTAGKKVINGAGEVIKSPFKYISSSGKNTWAKVKAGGFKGLAGSGGIAMLDYFAANVAEGIQEIGQEAISAATVGYYTEVLNNPAQGGVALKNQMIMSAMGDQFSGQGAEVFLSGFLMGGLVSIPQKIFFQGVPSIYNYGLQQAGIGLATAGQKEAYTEYKKNREEMVDKVVKSYNKSWDTQAMDPSNLFDPNRLNFMVQKEMAEKMKSSSFQQDFFGFIDAKDSSKFQQYYTMFATGGSYNFKNQLKGYLELSDEELNNAFPGISTKEKNSGKLRERINSMITGIDKMETLYNKNKDKNPNPFNKNKYNRKTQEREYIREATNEYAFEHVRYLKMFTENGFNRALERADGIYTKLQSDPLFEGMEAKDLTVLLDSDSIDEEIRLLNLEIQATRDADQGLGETNKTKREKIKRLQAIKKIVNDPQNRFKNGTFKRNKLLKGKLRTEFQSYIRFMASQSNAFVNEDNIDAALEQIVDHGALKGRARVYDKAIEFLANPEKFTEIQERQYEINKRIYESRAEITEAAVKQHVAITEANELVNQLAKQGVYADQAQMMAFLQTGIVEVLTDFFDDNGPINPNIHTVKYGIVQRLLNTYKDTQEESTTNTEAEKTSEEVSQEESEEARSAIDILLEGNGINIKIDTRTNSPLLVQTLERQYKQYRARQTRLGQPILESTEWLSSAEALNIRNTTNALKKIWASGEGTVGVEGIIEFVNPLESDVINEDIGFEDFLKDSEVIINNPLIQSVLNQSGLELSDIVKMADVDLSEGESPADTPQKQFYKGGVIADIYKITTIDKETNETSVQYRILNKEGNELPSDIQDFLDKNFKSVRATFLEKEAQIAKNALDALNENIADTTEFSFDGVGGLSYGQPVYKDGVKYIVVQKPQYSQKYGANQKLKVIKESDNVGPINERKFLFIKQGDFAGKFTVEETNFNLIPDSVTKIQIKDLTQLYPHVNYTNTIGQAADSTSDNQKGLDRYNMILSMLSPEQIEGLELVVSLGANSGSNKRAYAAQNRAGEVYKEANPLIDRVNSRYDIGIRIADPELRASINAELSKLNIDPSNSPDGVFAYLNNESFLIRDQRTNSIIDPRSMTREQASNVILQSNKNMNATEKAQALENVHNAFALNALIVTAFDNLNVGNEPSYFIADAKDSEGVNVLPFKIDLTPGGGRVAYAKGRKTVFPIPMDALLYDTADEAGNLFIYDLKYNKETGKREYNFTTNLKGTESDNLEDAIEAQLKKQNQWDSLLQSKDRYLVMVKLPNGTYAKVNVKSMQLDVTELDKLYVDIVNEAKKIVKITSKEERIEAAIKFNAEMQNRLFLSSRPGNMIELNVGPDGSIFISLDKENQDSINVGLDFEEVNSTSLEPNEIIKSLLDKYNERPEVGKLNAELKLKNFRKSFPTGTSPSVIYQNSTTEVLPNVVEAQTVTVSADSDAMQLSRDIGFIPAGRNNVELEEEDNLGRDNPTAEEDVDSVSYMSDAEYDEKLDNNFGDFQVGIDHIANKILRNEGELNDREKEMMRNPAISNAVNFAVMRQGGPGSLVGETVEKTKPTKLDKVKADLIALEKSITKDLTTKKEKVLAIRNSEEYKKLLEVRKKLERTANKLVGVTSNQSRIEKYNDFLDWAADNLPSTIGIDDLLVLAENGITNGYGRVGAFVLNLDKIAGGVDVSGTIYTSALSPYKYHEAFHAIFRTVLTQDQIKRYRGIAKSELKVKYGSRYKTELEKFRNSAKQYQDMTNLELENEFAEEYMADEFDAFKMNPLKSKTNTEIKSFFTKLIEWIKGVFSKYTSNELKTLYENIDSGKYKNAVVKANEFTTLDTSLSGSISIANALVRYDSVDKADDIAGELYVDSDVIDPLIRSMAGMFIKRVNDISLEEKSYNPTKVYNDLEVDFIIMLDPNSTANQGFVGTKKNYLEQIDQAFLNYPEDIKKEVFSLINIISDMDQASLLKVESNEDSSGLRSTSEFNKDAAEIGGFNSLSYKVRAYIATTTMIGTDFFGKTELTDNETLIVPVKFNEAYNGILKSVSNESNPATMLKRMYAYSRLNPQAKSVVDKLFNDTGLTIDALVSNEPFKDVTDGSLLISMLKGFENYKVDYIFNERDSSGNLLIYTASERDDINSQLDEWAQAYITKKKLALVDPNRVKSFLRVTKGIKDSFGESNSYSEIVDKSRKYSEEMFDLIGIRLSPNYIAFSIAKTMSDESLSEDPQLKSLVEGYGYVTPLSSDLLDQLYTSFSSDANIFSKKKDGMASRLTTLSINNATFDETIGASTFVNPNGDLVYAHQLPTYHLKSVGALNNPEKIKALKEDDYLKNNFLLQSEAFNQLSNENRLRVLRVAGSKLKNRISTNEDGQATEDILNDSISGNKATQSFGEFTPQEFAISLINNYTANFNRRSGKVDTVVGLGQQDIATAPVFLRVMEAANTGDLVSLPIIKAVTMSANGNVELTPQIINAFVETIRAEFERISRESVALEERGGVPGNLKDFNDSPEGRAFSFTNTGLLIPGTIQEALIDIAQEKAKLNETITFDQAVSLAQGLSASTIRNTVANNLNESFKEFDKLLTDLKVKDNLSTQVLQGLSIGEGVARTKIELSGLKLNLNTNSSHNLQQVFFNNWINSKSINDLLLGDQAVSLKDMVDKVKRAKLQNAAYYSAYSEVIDPSKGIYHASTDFEMFLFEEPKSQSSLTNEDIDEADAQAYITTKGVRYATFAFGRLSTSMAEMLNTIDAGNKISSDRAFGSDQNTINLASKQEFINSKKYVYMDGKTAVKMSVTVLTKEYTSKYNDITGKWDAKPNMVELHYLREQMEATEEENQNFSMAAPLSAIKMMKDSVNSINVESGTFDRNSDFVSTKLDTSYLGLQVINPSNKKIITDMNQIKELITSEQDDSVEIPGMLDADGVEMTVGDVRREYNNAVGQRVVLKYKNKRNLVFSFDTALDEFALSKEKGAITPNLAAFIKEAQKGLMASGASSNILAFFELENGSQKYNLNSPVTAKKFEQLFLTYFSKGTLREKVPGDAFALVSSFGHKIYRRVFEIENGIPTRSEVIRESAWKGGTPDVDINTLTQDNIPPGGVVVLDVLRTGVMEYKNGEATGLRYSEVIMPAMDKNIMDLISELDTAEIPDAIAKMFGVRIPTQDKHSAVNMRLVDFMPVYYGSSAIFPKELVEISGADFDIDKVYALIKEYYLDSNKNFREYGSGDSYFEYVKYMNNKVLEGNNSISTAAELYDDETLAIRRDNALSDSEQNRVTDDQGVNNISEEAMRAMLILGLPVTKKQFKDYTKKHGTPNEAVLNNEILDYRYALAGNTGMTESKSKEYKDKSDLPIAYQAADLQILETLFKKLSGEDSTMELFKGRIDSTVDVDNLTGMIKAFEANKGAAIGAIVKPNLYLSLLREYNINLKVPIKFNGNDYTGFGKYKVDGQRVQDVISSLITMETDNAKERLIAKFGLNIHAVGLAGNMLSLGVPLETIILLVNSAEIRDLYQQALNKEDQFDPGLDRLLIKRIKSLNNNVQDQKTKGNKPTFVRLSNEFLESAVDSTKDLTYNERLQILYLFKKFNDVKNFTSKMSVVTSLTQGMPKDIPSIKDAVEKLQILFAKDAPINLSRIYGKSSGTWQSKYLQIFEQIYKDLLPNTILTMSPEFADILKPVYAGMNTIEKSFDNATRNVVEQDLLSFLTIRSYQNLLNNSSGNSSVENSMLYPGPIGTTDLSLVTKINDLKLQREEQGAESNFFLDSFVGTQYANEDGNNTGMNLVDANTWRRLNAANKVDLQTSFARLYGSLETRELANDILHYMMVKDGLQLKYGSLMAAMSPFIMDKYLKNIGAVEQALKGEQEFEKVFGTSKEEIMKEFKYGYLQSNVVGPLLYTYDFDSLDDNFSFDVLSRPNKLTVTAEVGDYHGNEFVRIKSDRGGFTFYTLLRLLETEQEGAFEYVEVKSMGSNQQFGGGFVGGPRLSYDQTRNIGKGTTQNSLPEERAADPILDTELSPDEFAPLVEYPVDTNQGAIQDVNEVLNSPSAIVTQTNDSVTVKADVNSAEVNVSDTQKLLAELSQNSESVIFDETENSVLENVDMSLPETTEEQQQEEEQLSLDLMQSENISEAESLVEWWNSNVQGNPSALENMRQAKIKSLDDAIILYGDMFSQTEQGEQELIERLKCLI